MSVISSLGEVSGVPVIDCNVCTRCGACAEACPTGVLQAGPDGGIRIGTETSFGCIACAHCMMVCPADAVHVTGRGLRRDDIAALPRPEERATPGQLDALFRSRRSMRQFQDQPVARELLERVVAAATTAPMGIPPSEVGVVVLSERERVRELARDTVQLYAGFLRLVDHPPILWLLRLFLPSATFRQLRSFILPLGREIVAHAKAGEDKVLYAAPAALLFYVSPYADMADATIVCTYAMLAAETLNLGSCIIGCVAPPLARSRKLCAKHGIPPGHKPALVLILGHPALVYRRAVWRNLLAVQHP
ncbi:MAG: nitroreductase family protein [Opitutaceae bacterium]|nr:nitroreductase family protein [Opitutaceae bacterium]